MSFRSPLDSILNSIFAFDLVKAEMELFHWSDLTHAKALIQYHSHTQKGKIPADFFALDCEPSLKQSPQSSTGLSNCGPDSPPSMCGKARDMFSHTVDLSADATTVQVCDLFDSASHQRPIIPAKGREILRTNRHMTVYTANVCFNAIKKFR